MALGIDDLLGSSSYGKYCMGGFYFPNSTPSLSRLESPPLGALFSSPFILVLHPLFCVHVLIFLLGCKPVQSTHT